LAILAPHLRCDSGKAPGRQGLRKPAAFNEINYVTQTGCRVSHWALRAFAKGVVLASVRDGGCAVVRISFARTDN